MSGQTPGQARHRRGPQPTTSLATEFAQLGSTANGWRLEGKARNAGRCAPPSGAGEPEGLFALVRAGVIHQLVRE